MLSSASSPFKKYATLTLIFAVLVGIAGYQLMRPKLGVDEYRAQINNIAQEAARTNELVRCDALPETRSYLERHPRDGKGVEEPSVWTVGHPKEECRKEYTHLATDPAACELITNYPDSFYTQAWCYRRMAEIHSDPSYCQKMVQASVIDPVYATGAFHECEAIARLDASVCERIETSPHDPLTTRGTCIVKVVGRTHDAAPCLKIDRTSDMPVSWIEEDWRELRNKCIGSVAYHRQLLRQDNHELCQLMTTDTRAELPYRYKELCERGYYIGYQFFSVGEIPLRLRQP